MLESKHRQSHGTSVYCKVCGDRASGKHYGVPSCDGCRGFFKRSIRRNLEYICKEGGKCIVDVSRRNQCQACRFAKCLQANMRREAVQHERAPRSCINNHQTTASGLALSASHLDHLYASRRLHTNGLVLPIPMHMPSSFASLEPSRYYPSIGSFQSSFLDSFHFNPNNIFTAPSAIIGVPNAIASSITLTNAVTVPTTTTAAVTTNATTLPLSMTTPTVSSFSTKQLPDILGPYSTQLAAQRSSFLGKIADIAKEDEVSSSEEIRLHEIPTNIRNTFITYAESEAVFESAAKLLFLAVKWAKSVPSFNQISASDQSILLEECWAELFVITSAQYGLPIENLLVTSASTDISMKRLQQAIHKIILLRLDYTEMACLKTLSLFRPDCNELASPYEISMFQDETLKLMVEKSGATRMGHILLALPYIRAAADRAVIQELLFKKTVGNVAIEKLLGELMRT